MQRALLPGAVLACAFLSGCSLFPEFTEARFNNGEGASGETILVVPFRHSQKELWYGESRDGRGIVVFLRKWTDGQSIDALFVESESSQDVLHRIYNWPKNLISRKDWVELARPSGVRYVVDGDIVSLKLDNPLTVGYFDPEATIKYRVIDLQDGSEVHSRQSWKIRLSEKESQFHMSYDFDNPERVRAKLLAHIAKRLGQELYGYYDD
jgi:hypothetical protein